MIPQSWTLGEALKAEGFQVRETRIGTDPTEEEAEAACRSADGCAAVVFVSYDACFSAGQSGLIRELAPQSDICICTYENKPAMMSALAGVLSGRLSAARRLPVAVGDYPRGAGAVDDGGNR